MSDSPKLDVLKEDMASETNLPAMRTFITPNDLFFVRSRYPAPSIAKSSWTLTIEGEVENTLELTLDDLLKLPQKTLPVTMECAGNGRTSLDPPAPGLQFGTGAVSTAEWTGVPLFHILEQAKLKASAIELCMQAADQNPEKGEDQPEFYERGLILEKALDPDTLLVFQMNGEELPLEHGFPVRVIVPGWYGMASVKWLTRIVALDHSYEGHFNINEYVIKNAGEETKQVSTLLVKSLVTNPSENASLPLGSQKITGVAWSAAEIDHVDVSTDGGSSWNQAVLEEPKSRYAWRHWSYTWDASESGGYVIMSRAFDTQGNSQPDIAHWNELGYKINPVHSVPVVVS
jgi:DMSO/TMAO reductase YedYZ molybdopterin-dependent catalytic subunit